MSMKIYPILFNNHITKQNNSSSGSASNYSTAPFESRLSTSSSAVLPANFKGLESAAFAKELRQLKEVHCPVCGVKMIPYKDLQALVQEGEEIKDPESFALWLQNHKENMNEIFKVIPDSALKAVQNKDVQDTELLLDAMREDAYSASRKALGFVKNRIEETRLVQVFSDSDNVLLDEAEMRLENLKPEETNDLLRDVKIILQDTVGNLEDTDKWTLYSELKNSVKDASFKQHLFLYENDKPYKGSRQKQFLQKLFFLSSSMSQNIVTNFEEDRDLKSNVILTCKCCNRPRGEQLFKHYMDRPGLKDNFERYVEDIGQKILDGELKGSTDYPLTLTRFVSKLTRENINIDKFQNETLKKVSGKRFDDMHERVNFQPVSKRGIPCATCGKDTIVHEEKCEIFDEIKNAKDVHELMDILDDNRDLIRSKQKPLVRYWALNLKHNPQISEAELFRNLKTFSRNQINGQLEKNIKIASESLEKLTGSDKALVENFIQETAKLLDFPDNTPFPYDKYSAISKDTIYKIEDDDFRNRHVALFKESIRRLFSTHMLLYPNNATIKKVGSPLKVVAQNIIKGSVATIDYMVPISKNGWEDQMNAVVMCKNCNHEKTNYSLEHWHMLHPEMKQNMQKYLDKIVSLIKSGELKGMDRYPYVIASSVKKLTSGKVVLFFDLPKKTSKN